MATLSFPLLTNYNTTSMTFFCTQPGSGSFFIVVCLTANHVLECSDLGGGRERETHRWIHGVSFSFHCGHWTGTDYLGGLPVDVNSVCLFKEIIRRERE